MELIDAFSSRLPVMVIIDMLGLPQKDHDLFHVWYPAMMAGLTGTPEQRTYGIECNQQFHAYIDKLVDERSVNPGEDLISKLCIAEVDGARMSKEDIKAFSSLLLVAGGETTDKAIGEHVGAHDGKPRSVRGGEARPGPVRPRVPRRRCGSHRRPAASSGT